MLPRVAHDLPVLPGPLDLRPGDLACEEVLLRQPGEGDHWWTKLRVDGLPRKQLIAAMARAGAVTEDEVAIAGGRDRQAMAIQWCSIPKESVEHPKRLKTAGYKQKLKVLEIREGRGPIHPGIVAGLRWRCTLRGLGGGDGFVRGRAILDRVRRMGFPNYIAREMASGNQAKWGRMLAQGKPLPPRVAGAGAEPRRCLLAFRNQLFNRLVAARLEDDLLGSVLDGDVVEVHGNRPPPKRERELASEGQAYAQRAASWEAVPLLPLFGRELEASAGEARARELAVLAESEVGEQAFARLRGERRALRAQPTGAQVEIERGHLVLTCQLHVDCHIRSLLAEFVPGDDADDG